MKKVLLVALPAVAAVLVLGSCRTYIIPTDSFKQQMTEARNNPQDYTITNQSIFGKNSYNAYSIDHIDCVDKKGKPHQLATGPAIEIRFTHHGHKRTVFYFDSINMDDTSVSGNRSRIFGMQKRIPLSSITKIEVQNSGKYYHYTTTQK